MIDCDNVLNNVSEDWVMYLNKKHGLSINPNGLSHEKICKVFSKLSIDEIKFPLQDESFGKSYTVKPGSYECLTEMLNDGHEVSVVTSHFPFLTRDDVIITSKKHKIMGDVLIDDEVKNLLDGNFLKILFDHPNNHGYDAKANGMIRIYTLKEAYETIQKELLAT